MRITFANARVWRYVMGSISKFVEVGLMIVNDDGLTFKAMDPSRVALVEFNIPKESFDTFELEGEVKVAINVEDLGKILRSSEKDDRISLEVSENSLTIELERKGIPRMFVIPLHTGSEVEAIPELSLDLRNKFKVAGTTLYEGISSVEDLGDVLTFNIGEDHLSLVVKSDLGDAEIVFDKESGMLLEFEVNDPNTSVSYGVEYLSYVKQPIKLSETVDILLSPEMPCKLVLNLPQGAKMNYYVAPRVE